jgi:hypothetical protein
MKRRLALPKNVVLLSLIEATELASADARHKYAESPRSTAAAPPAGGHHNTSTQHGSPSFDELTAAGGGGGGGGGAGGHDLHSMGRDDDDTDGEEEEDVADQDQQEEEKIKMSTSLAVGVAGTYAVSVKQGLDILPHRPPVTTRSMDASSSNGQDDVESLVRVYQVDQHSKDFEENSTQQNSSSTSTNKRKDPLKLCYGDRVQVVALGGGWARLSRGYGFVRADDNQLVKGMSYVFILVGI